MTLARKEETQAMTNGNEYAGWLGVTQQQDAAETLGVLKDSLAGTDWLVVDHYGLDRKWHQVVRPAVGGVFVIDDLANRPHDCDVLLDHNLNAAGRARYDGLIPDSCTVLAGPQYALLRKEFVLARKSLRDRDGTVKHIHVFFGGVDATGETLKSCKALRMLGADRFQVDVVVGLSNQYREQIERACREAGFTYHCQITNMAELMARADLGIGAGGTTTWERAYVGLPAIVIPIADNQRAGSEAIVQAGAAWSPGYHDQVSAEALADLVRHVADDKGAVRETGRRALDLFGKHPVPGVERAEEAMKAVRHADA
jgi:UDP-2,4-diacetamido-2,4,6-trideoxy-beta-L-altropyranose hydrolase